MADRSSPGIDISTDVGERPGREGLDADTALLDIVSSANVACGGHAGDERSMTALCELAVARGVAIGAQVSYVDREGFGRRRLDVPPRVLVAQLVEQWGRLADAAAAAGTSVSYMRPHGALYNAALVDTEVAAAVVMATPAGTPVLCIEGTALASAAREAGHHVVGEMFADRAITRRGLLVPRGRKGAVVTSPADVQERIRRWVATGMVESVDGVPVQLLARSICIHSDTPGALAAAQHVRTAVEEAGSSVRPFAPSLVSPSTVARGGSATRAAEPVDVEEAVGVRSVSDYGPTALLVDVQSGHSAAWAAAARLALGSAVEDTVVAESTVLLVFVTRARKDDARRLVTTIRADVRVSRPSSTTPPGDHRTPVVIPTRYDGPDLRAVAEAAGMSPEAVVALHSAASYRVSFFGFAPGFAYLVGLPSALHVPRRAEPRPRVPAGSVAIAAAYSAVYPVDSPGGWHILGHTDITMFDPRALPPTPLDAAREVLFRAV